MSYQYFNVQDVKTKPDLWLCKPDRTAIHKMKDSFDEGLVIKFSAINELSFTIPVLIERNHKLVQNPLVNKIKERYLIRMKKDNQIEYFIILKINKKMSDDGFESISYQAYSLGITLAGKLIRDYEEISKNLSYLANDLLSQTFWKLDYVDADFDLRYRSFEVSSSNVLQCIFDLAEKFNAAIKFDTVQRKISFHNPKNIGKNKGLKLKEGRYLESFDLAIDPENMATRLKVYGQDGLEFRRLSPTGSNYIEDFSFFMYPFECDENYNVLKSSNGYMSDSLCIALTKYQDKLKSIQGQFDTLTTQSTTKREEIQKQEQELSMLVAKSNDLMNQRDVINYTYGDEASSRPDWQNVINQLNIKLTEISAKESHISTLTTQLKSIESQINQLRESVRVENNFTLSQIDEWNDYIIEREYYNDSIIDEEDLLEEAYSVFDDVRLPPINLSLSLENFLTNVEHNFNKDKLAIGDIISLKSKDLNVSVSAKIIDISFNYESGDASVTVSNTARENDDFSDLIEKLNLASNTSTTVNIDKFQWNTAENTKNELYNYIEGNLDSAKQLILGGMNDSVQLNERGLIARDMLDPDKTWLMIQNGQLFITADGGNKVEVAINKNGVFANRLFGKIILGNKLQVEDDLGIVVIESGAVKTYDTGRNLKTVTGRYQDPNNPSQWKYGLRVYGGSLDLRTSESANRGTQFDGNGIRTFNNNGVRTFDVDATSGLVSIIGNLNIKTSLDSNKGVTIDGGGIRGFNNSGQLKFEINTNTGDAMFGGRLDYARGTLDQVSGTVNNLGGTFAGTLNGVNGTFSGSLSAATGEFGGLVTGSLSTQTVNSIRIDADQINALRITSDMIDVNDLSAISANIGTITAGTLNGININTQQDINVGRNIYMQGRGSQRIRFADGTGIGSDGDGGMSINVFQDLNIQASTTFFFGKVDFRGATVIGIK